jgi:hypothetical protein
MVSEPGFNPGETVRAVLYSTPTELGTIKVDPLGRAIGSLPVPVTTPPGLHTLSLIGGNLVKSRTVEIIGPQLAPRAGISGVALAASDGSGAGGGTAAPGSTPSGIADAKVASAKARGDIPRTGPVSEPRDLAPTAALITLAGALWIAAARQYRLAVATDPQG